MTAIKQTSNLSCEGSTHIKPSLTSFTNFAFVVTVVIRHRCTSRFVRTNEFFNLILAHTHDTTGRVCAHDLQLQVIITTSIEFHELLSIEFDAAICEW